MPDLTPITREEMFLDGNTELTPITREEKILAGEDIDVITRREWFLKKYRGSGGEIVLENITITENGVVTAPSGKAYKKITTDVPLPENAYLLKEVDGLPRDLATFTDGANLPMPSLKVSIEPIQSGSGDPSPSNVRPISGWTEANVTRCGKNLYDIRTNRYMQGVEKLKVGDTLYIRTDYEIKYKLYVRYSGDNLATEYTIPLNETVTITLDRTIVAIALSEPDANSIISNNKEFTISLAPIDEVIPYNGHTTTIPFVDSQGNPVEVYGGECDVVNGTVKPNIEYDSYNGETLVGRWISDRDVYAEGTTPTIGAQVVDLGAYGSDISVQPTSIKSLEGVNNVYCNTGQIKEVSYFSKN